MSDRPNEMGYSRSWMQRGVRCQPAAPGHRPHRHLLPAPRLQRHGPRGAAARDRRAAARRQDPLLGRLQLPRLAHRRGGARRRAARHARPPVVCQPYYNLLNRMPEVEMLPACAHHGIGVVPYSPIARGVLSGKYAPGPSAAEGTRAGRGDKRIDGDRVSRRVAARRAETEGALRAQGHHAVALRDRLGAGAPCGQFGDRRAAHLRAVEGLPAGALECRDQCRRRGVGRFAGAPGHPSTPGYIDPAYPMELRTRGTS